MQQATEDRSAGFIAAMLALGVLAPTTSLGLPAQAQAADGSRSQGAGDGEDPRPDLPVGQIATAPS